MVVTVTGCFFLAAGIFNDFSLDEIWAYNIGREAPSMRGVLTQSKVEIHPLNIIYMYLMGDQMYWPLYRLEALAAGIGTLILVYLHARKLEFAEGFALAVFFSFSYLMILYGSEARGYSCMLFFILLSWLTIERFSGLSAVSTCLALFSHPGAVQYYLSIAAWRRKPLIVLVLPLMTLGGMYLTGIIRLGQASGNIYSPLDLAVNTFCVSFGAPPVSSERPGLTLALVILALALAVIFLREIFDLKREDSGRWLFYLLMIFIVPFAVMAASRRETAEVRYFLPSVAFSYFLAAGIIKRWVKRGWAGKLLAVCVLAGFVFGNSIYLTDFLRYGRGQYLKALQYIVENSPQDAPIRISSSFDFRSRMTIDFYRKYLPAGVDVRYESLNTPAHPPVDWHFQLSQDRFYEPPQDLVLERKHLFKLEREFRYTYGSGWNWYLYRKVGQ